jgi:hypothetical protein
MGTVGLLVAAFHVAKTAALMINLGAFPSLVPGDRAPGRPRTSILVPARDEASHLRHALPTLLAQPAEEILILDDESNDGTAGVVRDFSDPRLRVLTGAGPPAGWIGKNWACQQLANTATGDLLVFCDADVTLRPGALDALWAQMVRQHADVFSIFPRQHTGTLGERTMVPLLDENLLAFLPHPLLDAPVPVAAVANGQVLAFRRQAYLAVGGHQAVAGKIVEDLALAQRSRRAGLKLGLALGQSLVSARMYDGYASTVRGMGKSMRAVHRHSDLVLAASAAFNLTAYTVPWLRWSSGPAWRIAALLGPAERLLVNAKTGRGAYPEAVLVPFTAPVALPVYLLALRRSARWKGRSYSDPMSRSSGSVKELTMGRAGPSGSDRGS